MAFTILFSPHARQQCVIRAISVFERAYSLTSFPRPPLAWAQTPLLRVPVHATYPARRSRPSIRAPPYLILARRTQSGPMPRQDTHEPHPAPLAAPPSPPGSRRGHARRRREPGPRDESGRDGANCTESTCRASSAAAGDVQAASRVLLRSRCWCWARVGGDRSCCKLRFYNPTQDEFGYLRDDGVAESSTSVHCAG
jgi:hypothetical protein